MRTAELALALGGTFLELCLLAVLVGQRAYRIVPAFFSCTAFSAFTTAALFLVRNHPIPYLWVYWGTEALYVLLAFLVLLEVFKSVFRGFYHLPWFRFLFPGIGVLMLCVATVRSVMRPPAEVNRAFAVIIFLELAVRFLQLGILFLFFALVRFFHMMWRQYAFGIAFGFGVSAAGSLVVFLLRSEFGTKLDYVVRITPPIAYTLAVAVWLLTFLIPQPAAPLQGKASALTPEEMLAEIRLYSKAVKQILKR